MSVSRISARTKVSEERTKTCPKCGVVKALASFGRDATRIDGRYSYCKQCRRVPNRKDREVLELAAKGLKVCTRCLKTKPFCAFEKDMSKSLGVTSRCKKCKREQRRLTVVDTEPKRPQRSKSSRDYTRWEVFEDDDFTCYICEETLSPDTPPNHPRSLSIDHVLAISRGGKDERDNVRTACLSCNTSKSDMLLEDFLLKIGA